MGFDDHATYRGAETTGFQSPAQDFIEHVLDLAQVLDLRKPGTYPVRLVGHPRDYDRWLDRGETERLPVDLLRPYESDEMEMHEANPLVGNVRNNGPEMLTKP